MHAVSKCKDKLLLRLSLHVWHKKLLKRLSCRCPTGTSLKGSSQTGHWGYWYDLLQPALVIGNDTEIEVEMPTFEAGLAREGTSSPSDLSVHVVTPITQCSGCHNGTIGTQPAYSTFLMGLVWQDEAEMPCHMLHCMCTN